jgi:hypothetical protein
MSLHQQHVLQVQQVAVNEMNCCFDAIPGKPNGKCLLHDGGLFSLVEAISTWSDLLHPSECTLCTHEVLHVVDDIMKIGLPRHCDLFKFEMTV